MSTVARVLHLTPELGWGGAQRMLVDLVTRLDRGRYDPAVASLYAPQGTPGEAELASSGVPVFHLGKRLGPDPRMCLRIDAVIRRFQPQLIHTHRYVLRYALPSLLLRRSRVAVHTVHNLAQYDCGRPRFLTTLAFRCGVVPVAIGDEVAASIARVHGVSGGPCIPYGIDVQSCRTTPAVRAQWRQQLELSAGDVVYVNVARLAPQKNQALLLDAFGALLKRGAQAVLLVVGAGDLRGDLERQAGLLGLQDRVRFLGARADVPGILAASDVFVLSSVYEGNPLSVMEAMAAGKPVVSTAVGGVAEAVRDGVTGRLVPPGDAAALATAMAELGADEDERRRLGAAAALEAAQRFDVAIMVRNYEELYARLLRRSG